MDTIQRLHHTRYKKGNTTTAALRDKMQKTMQEHAAVYRTSELLAQGVPKMQVGDIILHWRYNCVQH